MSRLHSKPEEDQRLAKQQAEAFLAMLPAPVGNMLSRDVAAYLMAAMVHATLPLLDAVRKEAWEEAKHHGLRLAALEVNKLQPNEHDDKGQRDYFWGEKRKVWLACREAVVALLP